MDIQTFYNTLPNPSPTRDQMILDAINAGLTTINWIPINSSFNGHTAVFNVCDDALRVELSDGSRFRFAASATLLQKCADLLNASMVTAKIMDLRYQQAALNGLQVDATILPAIPEMINTSYSKQWNSLVETKRNNFIGLFSDCGKTWVLDNGLSGSAGAVNYGFYAKNAIYTNPIGIKLYQNLGFKHNASYCDESQTAILMSLDCIVDGQAAKVTDIMTDPNLYGLITYNSPLKYTRQPGV